MPQQPRPESRPREDDRGGGLGSSLSVSVVGFLLIVAVVFWTAVASPKRPSVAEAYVPDSGQSVLERLPAALVENRDRWSRLRDQLAENPEDPNLAQNAARAFIDAGDELGDARFYGYAQSAIQRWWTAQQVPAGVLSVRAKLREKSHDYVGAAIDLQSIVRAVPSDGQAWVELCNLYRVMGRYDDARKVIERLEQMTDGVPVATTSIPIDAVTGRLDEAVSRSEALQPQVDSDFPSLLPWWLAMRGSLARQAGRYDRAEEFYRNAIGAGGGGSVRRELADLLLSRDRGEQVIKLMGLDSNDNGSMVRIAIAARRAGRDKLANRLTESLQRRFEDIRLRGDTPHGRFEAMMQLELLDNPGAALEIALANWRQQRELIDSRLVLRTAVAANRGAAVATVIAFLERHGTQDAEIEGLIERLPRP